MQYQLQHNCSLSSPTELQASIHCIWIVPVSTEYVCVQSRGERIIRYSNIIRILEQNTSIRIRIRVTFFNRILFVFVFGQFSQTEYYSYSYSAISQTEYYLYSYSGDFLKPNIICICILIWEILSNRILFVLVFG